MNRYKAAGAPKGAGILNALKAMEMIDVKSKLPAGTKPRCDAEPVLRAVLGGLMFVRNV